MVSFLRNRWLRDAGRRDWAGDRRWDLFTEIRRLGTRRRGVLATLRSEAAALGFAGAPVPAGRPLTAPEALRYLRDPSLRHWIAEDRGRVFGHLVAHLQLGYAGPPTMVVTEVGVRPEHRVGLVGPLLAAALCDEAARWEVREIVALASDPALAGYLRGLGFAHRPKRPVLLRVPD